MRNYGVAVFLSFFSTNRATRIRFHCSTICDEKSRKGILYSHSSENVLILNFKARISSIRENLDSDPTGSNDSLFRRARDREVSEV